MALNSQRKLGAFRSSSLSAVVVINLQNDHFFSPWGQQWDQTRYEGRGTGIPARS